MAMYGGPSWLLLAEALHLLAAGAWLGGLLPLALLVAAAPPSLAAAAARRFSRLGMACVVVIAGTALFQFLVLMGGLPGLLGTAYGLVGLLKTLLFLLLLGFAAYNRFRLVPALAKSRLVRSIAAETATGLLTVLAAGLLTSLAPAMHAQPVWPFAHRLTLETVGEDPEFLHEVLAAAAALLAASALILAAFLLRWRARWVLAVLAAVVAWRAVPHLDLLTAPAYPTQFWTSPTRFSTASIVSGMSLFPENCVACHGAEGRGNGPAAASLPIRPADLTAAHLWAHPDGELFWWLSHGIEGPDGQLVMPGFAGALTEEERWALIDWVRAHNAGLARRSGGTWPVMLQAPALDLSCPDPSVTELADLRGQPVRLVFRPVAPAPGITTVVLDPAAAPAPGICTSRSTEAADAYATVAGIASSERPGAEILIDRAGWLGAVLADDRSLAQELRDLDHRTMPAPPSHAGMRM
jgi:mono/diheme cytochrome c family protein